MSAVLNQVSGISFGLRRAVVNYLSTMAFILIAYAFYTKFSSYHIRFYDSNWSPTFSFFQLGAVIRSADLFRWAVYFYAVALVPFYALQPTMKSKAALCLEYVASIQKLSALPLVRDSVRQAFLSLLLKFIFVPFCLNGLLGHCAVLNNQVLVLGSVNLGAIAFARLYGAHLHLLMLNIIFIFDFVPFLVGYMFESRWLKNEIRSVDASLSGWVVCLMCYPPFNGAVGQFFSWTARDYADMSLGLSEPVYFILNGGLVVLFALYASASVSLGFKCSNLTNRGVVSSGLYGRIRHPAYALKNAAWWLAGLPVFVFLFKQSIALGVFGLFSLGGWTMLYILRAITEERHMLRIDTGYAAYMKRVPYRFIPGLF
jgi:protein-S-isoprenylcysteine O-methyltransferase Ste14